MAKPAMGVAGLVKALAAESRSPTLFPFHSPLGKLLEAWRAVAHHDSDCGRALCHGPHLSCPYEAHSSDSQAGLAICAFGTTDIKNVTKRTFPSPVIRPERGGHAHGGYEIEWK